MQDAQLIETDIDSTIFQVSLTDAFGRDHRTGREGVRVVGAEQSGQRSAVFFRNSSAVKAAPSPTAFISNQMGYSDYSMLVKVYGRWIDSESPREMGRIWQGVKKLVQIAHNLPN